MGSPRSTPAIVITDRRKRGLTLLQLTTPLWLPSRLGLAAVVLFALLLSGCGSIPFFGKDKEQTDEEVEELIGADWLIYQDLEDLIAAAAEGNPEISRYECSVFDGDYITGDVDEVYLKRLETIRSDAAKAARKKKKSMARQQNLVADLQSDG